MTKQEAKQTAEELLKRGCFIESVKLFLYDNGFSDSEVERFLEARPIENNR